MSGRSSPVGKSKNAFGEQLRKLRLDRGLSAARVIAKLGLLGWDVAPSSYSQIESGQRILGDLELLMILKVIGVDVSELEVPKKLQLRK